MGLRPALPYGLHRAGGSPLWPFASALVCFLLTPASRASVSASQIVREHNVRIINIHFPGLAGLHFTVLRAVGLFRGGLVLSFHLSDARAAAETRGLERWMWRRMLRSADMLITVSDDMHPDLLSVDPGCGPKLLTLHNGVDVEFCSAHPLEQDRFPLECEGKPVILSIGNFMERKGHHILMRAFRLVLDRIPEARLVIVGGVHGYLSELKRLHAELELEGRAFMIEDVPHEQIPAYLSRSRPFALATHAEAFSLVILEAGAAGLPIVSTRVRGIVEQLRDGETAKLVNAGDIRGLATALLGTARESSRGGTAGQEFPDGDSGIAYMEASVRRVPRGLPAIAAPVRVFAAALKVGAKIELCRAGDSSRAALNRSLARLKSIRPALAAQTWTTTTRPHRRRSLL